MADINNFMILGRLTKDVELAYSQGGMAITKGSVAVGMQGKDKRTSFFDFTIFGKLGEAVAKYMTKGKQVALTGYLNQDTWTDQQTGAKKSKVSLVVQDLQLLGGNGNNNNNNGGNFQDDVPFDRF